MPLKFKFSPAQLGIVLVIAPAFFLTAMDAIVKFLSADFSVIQLVWVRYFGQTVLVTVLFWQHLHMLAKTKHPLLQCIRSFCLFGGTMCFFVGIANVDLISATTILQTSPLMIAILAHFMLSERLGLQRVLGISIGLIGTLVIIRPGTAVFSPYSLFSVGGAIFFSMFAILTRYLSRDEDIWSSFLFTTVAGAVISTIIVPFSWQMPTISDLPWFALLACCAAIGHLLFLKAHFLAEATVLAPFTYVALIFAAANGAVFFDNVPDILTIIGASIVVGSGLFVWHRETKSRAAH